MKPGHFFFRYLVIWYLFIHSIEVRRINHFLRFRKRRIRENTERKEKEEKVDFKFLGVLPLLDFRRVVL
jgi:hypothetical protein